MYNCVIMCRSISYAQRGERILERNSIRSYIVKTPQQLSSEGCSYGLRLRDKNKDKAVIILKNSGVRIGKVYRIDSDGIYNEVNL